MFVILVLYLNQKHQPYMSKHLNDLQFLSLFASMVTVYFGIYFISNMNDFYSLYEDIAVSEELGCIIIYKIKFLYSESLWSFINIFHCVCFDNQRIILYPLDYKISQWIKKYSNIKNRENLSLSLFVQQCWKT
jgi:hypothetical protein